MKSPRLPRLETGVRNLDALLGGGFPRGSMIVLAGPPGAGKTILTQQICFHNASPAQRVLYFNTLSEPTAKTLRYLSQFSYFEPEKLDAGGIQFIDLGEILRAEGLAQAAALIMSHVKATRPAVVVIDSFKVFNDLSRSDEELRKFGYEVAINLMAWETTTFLLGEYGPEDLATNPIFSIVDSLVMVTQREQSGEQQRFLQVIKARGTQHSRDEHSFIITSTGIDVFAPRVTIQRARSAPTEPRCKTGISRLDDLLGEGISRGASVLVSGVAGTGKTVFLLEFLYRGALAGEKGLLVSFEETPERLRATARGMGWEFERELERGMIEIVFIPQPEIMVERHMLLIQDRVRELGARRLVIDSVSVFLHKVKDPEIDREKIFQLASIVHNAGAVGLFATDIPYGSRQISRLGVEETVVDGVFILSSVLEGLERQRYVEIYKLRNTAHLKGRHDMTISHGGISVFPRYNVVLEARQPAPPLALDRRLSSGVAGLDALLGGGLLERSATLVSGSAGVGKSTFGMQFVLEGARQGEQSLFVALEEGPDQLLTAADGLHLGLRAAIDASRAEILFLSREHVRANQYLTILTDKIEEKGVRRLVLDSVTYLLLGGEAAAGLRQLLYVLVNRFKRLGVTSLLTLEADSMYSRDTPTDRGLSPVADNLIQLRYARLPGELRPTVTVVKSRGTRHDRGTYFFDFAAGGIRLGPRVDAARGPGEDEREAADEEADEGPKRTPPGGAPPGPPGPPARKHEQK